MPLPSDVDKRIRERFQSLLRESDELLEEMTSAEIDADRRSSGGGFVFIGTFHVLPEKFTSLRTRTLTLVYLLSEGSNHLERVIQAIEKLQNNVEAMKTLRGYLSGIKDDYEAGMLDSISQMIEANVAADYLGQAEQLLKEGQPGKYDHVPAAVLTGAILEDALRRLCDRQNPPISLTKPNGDPKTLNIYIDDLKKANVFNELKAKQLRSHADIRNAAAHGEFTKFNHQDVEQMLIGVQNFLADYL